MTLPDPSVVVPTSYITSFKSARIRPCRTAFRSTSPCWTSVDGINIKIDRRAPPVRPSRPTRQTLGEDKMSLMARLTPSMLGILNKVNTVAGLGGAKAHRCLLRQVKLFVVATRDLYRIPSKCMTEIRGKLGLHLRNLCANTSKRHRTAALLTAAVAAVALIEICHPISDRSRGACPKTTLT